MMTSREPKLEIIRCDNGYVVEWHQREYLSRMHKSPPSYGVSIFRTDGEMIAFVTAFFAADLIEG